MARKHGATAAGLILLAGIFTAQAFEPVEPREAKSIAQLIRELDHDNFVLRERATQALIERGPDVLEPLKKAMANGPSLELKSRGRQVLDKLAIHEAGGPVVHGLKIRLETDKDQIRPGDKLQLTTTLANMTDHELNIQVGYTTCGRYFDCGSTLQLVDAGGKTVKPQWRVDICGTGAGPIYVTIPARGVVQYTAPVVFEQENDKTFYFVGRDKFVALEASSNGVHRLRMVHTVQGKQPAQGSKGAGIAPTSPNAPYWTGTAQSNDIEIKINR